MNDATELALKHRLTEVRNSLADVHMTIPPARSSPGTDGAARAASWRLPELPARRPGSPRPWRSPRGARPGRDPSMRSLLPGRYTQT
jgi:hypothetical protein